MTQFENYNFQLQNYNFRIFIIITFFLDCYTTCMCIIFVIYLLVLYTNYGFQLNIIKKNKRKSS